MYKLTENGVLRLSDNAFIPAVGGNRDWQAYQAWLVANGNTPAAQYTLDEAKAYKVDQLFQEALARVRVVYPALKNPDAIDLVKDIILSIAPAARQIQSGLATIQEIQQVLKDTKVVINSLTIVADVLAYDVINTPEWP